MPSVFINDDEWDLLIDEPPELIKLYVAIKRKMDFKSGVAGITARINDNYLMSALNVAAVRGRKAVNYGRGAMRSKLERLEVLGLLKHIGPNVFKINCSTSDKSVQMNSNQPAARTATKQQPEQQPEKTPAEVIQLRNDSRTPATPIPEHKPAISSNSSPSLISYDLDRYTAANIHEFLKTVMDERSLINAHNRKIMAGWLELKINHAVLQEAVSKAVKVKQGQAFGVSYLDPIIKQIVYQKNNHGGEHEKSTSGQRANNRHGQTGNYLREQQALAEEYTGQGDKPGS